MTGSPQALADAVRSRRASMGWTQSDVAERGGPSDTTLSKIESASPSSLAERTLRRLDTGLGWSPGTARQIYLERGSRVEGDAPASGKGPLLAEATNQQLLAELAGRLGTSR
ncbi:helix-turn-helix transcriptional regulator [Terracoccus sp. 273MFTsu3.1]|uniref:helix-turn-helix domain-containing protein n=1 Tax=Terracoccus sp. 273MFTsu3.1 TaxID=1172188 RepID=UPI0009DB8589